MDDNKNILIIDDDKDLSMITSDMLEDYGYNVTCAENSDIAFELMKDNIFHLIILDINLPDTTGFEICKELRKVSSVPVIFASARTSEDDKIIGLDIGGDDYIPKPYSLKELLSRVNSLIRRTYGFQKNDKKYVIGSDENKIEISTANRTVMRNSEKISLSLKEFDVLVFLAKHMNETVSKETILSEVWGAYSEIELSTVAVHIRWLREKLEENPSKPTIIKTVWGIGYTIES